MTQELVKQITPLDDGSVVTLHGDVDFGRSPELRVAIMQLLATKPQKRLVIDLQDVPYMDSSGVAVFVEALQKQRHAGNKLILCNLSTKVRSILEISRLDMVFTLADDVEAAKTA